MGKTAIIIPSRYASTRLHAKPLIEVGGKPIIQWVYEKASKVKLADTVIIATDHEEIFNCAKSFGANRTQQFFNVAVPACMPSLFAGVQDCGSCSKA